MEEAASIPLVALTAWQALVEKTMQKGQKVFIQAGSGGVGTFAIQLDKLLDATVATTTSATNVPLVKSLGTDSVIDYKTQDFEDVLHGYDVVLNSQDGKTLAKSSASSRSTGSSFPSPVRLIPNSARKAGPWVREANGSQLREITRLIDAGLIRPAMDRVFPFESTNEAMAYVEGGRAKGKVVVKVRY